jgi:Ca2+-binding EF-hand superfamily protein
MALRAREQAMLDSKSRTREMLLVFEHKEGSRMVDIKEVPTLVRALGVNPSPAQLDELAQAIVAAQGPEQSGPLFPVDALEAVVATFLVDKAAELARDNYLLLLRAFKAFDPENRGYLEWDAFRDVVVGKGDALSDAEAKAMAEAAGDGTGRVFYEDYARALAGDRIGAK